MLPAPVQRAISRMLGRLPDSVSRRLVPRRFEALPNPLPEVVPLEGAERRILIAPLNTAGQARRWAAALRAVPGVTAVNLMIGDSRFGFESDASVPTAVARVSRDWQRRNFKVRALSATDIVIESATALFGPIFGQSIVREVRALQAAGVRVAVLCHGSDVRSIAALNARNPYSPYADPALADRVRKLEKSAAERRRRIRRLDVPVMGSTHGVLLDLPEAIWVPVTVDVDAWALDETAFGRTGPLRVVHAPSDPALKGSDVVERVLARLADEGRIDYERLGLTSHAAMRDAYARCDVVVDSLRLGGYGVTACEAMAAGRAVVSYIDPLYRTAIRESYGVDLPIVQATPDTLTGVICGLAADRSRGRAIAEQGPGYARRLHDGRVSAARILAALDSPAALGARR